MRTVAVLLLVIPLGCDASRERAPVSSTPTALTTLTVDAAALAALDNDSRAAVARSPVPVLIPKRPELLKVGKVMAEENWYAFHASHDGLTVAVGASKIEHHHDDIAPTKGKRTVRGVPGFIVQNEGIWSLSWREGGISYSLDLECAEPSEARCSNDETLLSIARDLVYVGGVK